MCLMDSCCCSIDASATNDALCSSVLTNATFSTLLTAIIPTVVCSIRIIENRRNYTEVIQTITAFDNVLSENYGAVKNIPASASKLIVIYWMTKIRLYWINLFLKHSKDVVIKRQKLHSIVRRWRKRRLSTHF